MTRGTSALPVAFLVVLGSALLAAALNAGAAARAAPAPPTPAILLTVGERSKPGELIRLLREVGRYEPFAAAHYVVQADAAFRRGEAPVVRVPMPSMEAAEAVVQAVPSAGASASVEPMLFNR